MTLVATGIVRRIDDLGRVVVPKELRRTMRIKEGDPLEIYTHGKEIILKKYQPMINIDEYAQTLADSLFDTFNNAVFVADDKEIVAASGIKKKEYLGKDTESIFPQFQEVKEVKMDENEKIPLGEDEGKKAKGYVYVPVMDGDKWLGAIFMLGTEKPIDESMKKSLLIQRQFIERRLAGMNHVSA